MPGDHRDIEVLARCERIKRQAPREDTAAAWCGLGDAKAFEPTYGCLHVATFFHQAIQIEHQVDRLVSQLREDRLQRPHLQQREMRSRGPDCEELGVVVTHEESGAGNPCAGPRGGATCGERVWQKEK